MSVRSSGGDKNLRIASSETCRIGMGTSPSARQSVTYNSTSPFRDLMASATLDPPEAMSSSRHSALHSSSTYFNRNVSGSSTVWLLFWLMACLPKEMHRYVGSILPCLPAGCYLLISLSISFSALPSRANTRFLPNTSSVSNSPGPAVRPVTARRVV